MYKKNWVLNRIDCVKLIFEETWRKISRNSILSFDVFVFFSRERSRLKSFIASSLK